MSNLLEGAIGGSLPSNLTNPFDNACIQYVHLDWATYRNKKIAVEGSIRFKKGDTEGKQNFTGASFSEVLYAMELFCRKL